VKRSKSEKIPHVTARRLAGAAWWDALSRWVQSDYRTQGVPASAIANALWHDYRDRHRFDSYPPELEDLYSKVYEFYLRAGPDARETPEWHYVTLILDSGLGRLAGEARRRSPRGLPLKSRRPLENAVTEFVDEYSKEPEPTDDEGSPEN